MTSFYFGTRERTWSRKRDPASQANEYSSFVTSPCECPLDILTSTGASVQVLEYQKEKTVENRLFFLVHHIDLSWNQFKSCLTKYYP